MPNRDATVAEMPGSDPHVVEAPDSDAPVAEARTERERPSLDEYDAETLARRDAALRYVRKLGDPVLRAKALPVDRFDDRLKAEIERMGQLMNDSLGVGLAATQVGILHRVFVYRAYSDDEISVLVNPVLEHASAELEIGEEGCLSIPGVHVDVERPAEVRMRGHDANGSEVVVEASGLEARVLQHELDHLDGILILDHISREERKVVMRAMREAAQGESSRASDASDASGRASDTDTDAGAATGAAGS